MSVITEFAAAEIVSRANVNQRIADANSVLSSAVSEVEGSFVFDNTEYITDAGSILKKYGRLVVFQVSAMAKINNGYTRICTLPEGFRPPSLSTFMWNADSGVYNQICQIDTAGVVSVRYSNIVHNPIHHAGTAVFFAAN